MGAWFVGSVLNSVYLSMHHFIGKWGMAMQEASCSFVQDWVALPLHGQCFWVWCWQGSSARAEHLQERGGSQQGPWFAW